MYTWNTCYLFKIWLSYILLKYTLNMCISLTHIKGQHKLTTRPLSLCEAKCSRDNLLTLHNIHNKFCLHCFKYSIRRRDLFYSFVHIIPRLPSLSLWQNLLCKLRNSSVNASPTACMIRLQKFHAWKTSVKIYVMHQYCSQITCDTWYIVTLFSVITKILVYI